MSQETLNYFRGLSKTAEHFFSHRKKIVSYIRDNDISNNKLQIELMLSGMAKAASLINKQVSVNDLMAVSGIDLLDSSPIPPAQVTIVTEKFDKLTLIELLDLITGDFENYE